jgi:hypothetical protein
VRRAIDELGPAPALERLDAASESRLRDVALLCCSRKIQRFGKSLEISEPGGFHDGSSVFLMPRKH